jgi:hypothetical protein
MKKLSVFALLIGILALGVSNAYAVPTIDGTLTAGEWDNTGFYPYYLQVSDPNEADNQFDNMDISNVVLLQELNAFSGDANAANDGVYLLIETYVTPPSLSLVPLGGGVIGAQQPTIRFSGDFLGDGFSDGFNIFIRHYNTDFAGAAAPGSDVVDFCVGSSASCTGIGAVYTAVPTSNFERGTVLEYFFPTGSAGTPANVPFPGSFSGFVTYDNGASGINTADDLVVGQVTAVPEPGTFFLLGAGLLSMLGFGKFGRNQ